jgi:glycosyltransferase involved in cell wall biosynthesis
VQIVIDARRYDSGIWVYLSSLIRWLQRIDRENDYHLIVHREHDGCFQLENPRFAQWLTRVPIENHLVGEPWRNIYLPYRLRRMGVDLFHDPGYFVPVLRGGARRVVTFHDMVPFVHKETNSRKYFWYMRNVIRLAARMADHIIAVSEHTKRDIIDTLGTDPERITVIHSAARAVFRVLPRSDSLQAVLERHKIRQPYILNVGTIEPRKNIPRLLEAYHRLRRRHRIPHQLVIAGALGWLYKPVFETLEKLDFGDDVRLTGFVSNEELNVLYNLADIFVFPSLYEGFGLPLLEALSCGAAVAASRTSCIPEILGTAAVYFEPTEIDSICEALLRLIEDGALRAQLKERAPVQAAKFTWEETARQTLAVYTRVCS